MSPTSLRRLVLTLGVSAVVGLVGCTSGPPPPTSIGAPSLTSTQRTTLIDAAARGDLSAVRAALGAGADVRTTDADGATALVRAAYGNHVEVAETLLAAGADPNHQDRTQQSAYLIATSEVGDDVRLLHLVLAHGADVNAKDSYNGTGLIRAAERGYPRIVARLIAAGIDLNHVNRLGWTALLEAVILGSGGPAHQAVVRELLAAGADRRIPDRNGVTALEHARRNGAGALVALLVAGPASTG
jgi:ankyrin repeat protein